MKKEEKELKEFLLSKFSPPTTGEAITFLQKKFSINAYIAMDLICFVKKQIVENVKNLYFFGKDRDFYYNKVFNQNFEEIRRNYKW